MLNKTCIFGHAPEGAKPHDTLRYQVWLCLLIERQIALGRTSFVSGGRPGVDLWCAAYIADLKRTNRKLKLYVYLNHADEAVDGQDKKLLRAVIAGADEIHIARTDEEAARHMIDASRFCLSVGAPTHLMHYARERKIGISQYTPSELAFSGHRLCR